MKLNLRICILFFLIIGTVINNPIFAGNQDRSGQAGGSELLINPWARSSGWGSVNNASVQGLESMYSNVAGLTYTQKTELLFSRTQWLKGSDVNINAFGLSQRVGKNGVLAFSVMSMSFGECVITTYDLPDGGIGKFSPSYMNINIAYAKKFTSFLSGGMNFKIISEVGPADASAQGIALDAGVQYKAAMGKTRKDTIRIGISLKNVGPKMKFTGDGLSFRSFIPGSVDNQMTVEQRSEPFELPSLVNIGAMYDLFINDKNKLTFGLNFTSNSFTKDLYTGGLQYTFYNCLMLRGAYTMERQNEEITSDESQNSSRGISGGMTVEIPLSKEKGSTFAVDYSYRQTYYFNGTHSIGVRVSL